MKKILAISGSLREGSSNTRILQQIAAWLPAEIEYSIYKRLDTLPHFSPPDESEALPPSVQDLHEQLNDAGAVIICTPEYAFGLPGSLKNMLDWTVGTGNFVNKLVAIITASSKGDDAHANLQKTLGALSAIVPKDCTLLIPFIRSKMDQEGNVIDEQTKRDIKLIVDSLLKAIQ